MCIVQFCRFLALVLVWFASLHYFRVFDALSAVAPLAAPSPPQQPGVSQTLFEVLTKANKLRASMTDEFVSVEHLVLAICDDVRFGQKMLAQAGVTKRAIEGAVKKIRGSSKACAGGVELGMVPKVQASEAFFVDRGRGLCKLHKLKVFFIIQSLEYFIFVAQFALLIARHFQKVAFFVFLYFF